MPLPLEYRRAEHWRHPTRGLRTGAEQYLECEDNGARSTPAGVGPPSGRNMALRGCSAGEWGEFRPADPNNPNTIEEPFRQEVLAKDGPREIISLTGDLCRLHHPHSRQLSATLETRPAPGKFLTTRSRPRRTGSGSRTSSPMNISTICPNWTVGLSNPLFAIICTSPATAGRRVAMINPGYGGAAGSPHARLARAFFGAFPAISGTFQLSLFPRNQYSRHKNTSGRCGPSHQKAPYRWHGQGSMRSRRRGSDSFGLPGPVKGEWHVFAKGAIGDPAATPAGFCFDHRGWSPVLNRLRDRFPN